jgi:hypothetical protein
MIVAFAWIGCTVEGPDIVGDWVANRVDAYVLADNGGVEDLTKTKYPVEEPLDPAEDGAIAEGTNLRLSFAEDGRVDEIVETYRAYGDADPVVVDDESTRYTWEDHGRLEVKLLGSDADDYACSIGAGPDTLVCNFVRESGDGLHVVSTRYHPDDAEEDGGAR